MTDFPPSWRAAKNRATRHNSGASPQLTAPHWPTSQADGTSETIATVKVPTWVNSSVD